MNARLKYAATTVDVTPPTMVPLAGYVARQEVPATGTHDRLTASLLWLSGEAGESSVCWIGVDALGLDVPTTSRIRASVADRIGIDPDAVLVCSSHTHSGPASWCRSSGHLDPDAIDRLVKDICRGAARLPAIRATVTAGWATVGDAGVGSNRYALDGPHDTSTGVLSLRDDEDSVVTVLFDYACHPTVLGHANLEYSADYPAATRRVVRAALTEADGVETPPVVVFLQGAAGDVSTRFTRRGATFAEADRQGAMLAGSLLRGVLAADPTRLAGMDPVVLRGTCVVPTRPMPGADVVRETLAAAEREWTRLDPGDGPETPEIRIARTRHEGAKALAALRDADLPPALELPISVVAVGDVAWVHLPVEPFTHFGALIRAMSPFGDTRTIGYTDGYFGYLADEPAYEAGRYEALSSVFGPEAGALVVKESVALLHKAHAMGTTGAMAE